MKIRFLHLVIVAISCLICYSNSFEASFHYDDSIYLSGAPTIDGEGDRGHFLIPSVTDFEIFVGHRPDLQLAESIRGHPYFTTRLTGYASLLADYAASGGDVTRYHVTNFICHLANSILVYLIVLLLLQGVLVNVRASGTSWLHLPFVVALLFALHPIQTEAVTYIVQRFVLLAAFFWLVAVASYAGSGIAKNKGVAGSLYVVAILSCMLAMMSKESALTLPIVLLLYDSMFRSGRLWKRVSRLSPFFLTGLIVVIPYLLASQSGGEQFGFGQSGRFQSSTPRLHYLFTEFGVILKYLQLIVFPFGQNVDHGWEIRSSFFDLSVIAPLVVHIALLGSAVTLLIRHRDVMLYRLIAFGILWFYVGLGVESSVIPLSHPIVEYRAYLPSSGIVLALTAACWVLLERLKSSYPLSRAVPALALILMSVSLGTLTYSRNEVWKNEIRFWTDVVEKSPHRSAPYLSLGKALREAERYAEALACYESGLKLASGDFRFHNNIANVYSEMGRHSEAIAQLRLLLAQDFSPEVKSELHYNIAHSYELMESRKEAIESYLLAIKANPWNLDACANGGLLLVEQGDVTRGITLMQEALRRDPRHALSRLHLAKAYISTRSWPEARKNLEMLLERYSDVREVHELLARVYTSLSLPEKAKEHRSKAQALLALEEG